MRASFLKKVKNILEERRRDMLNGAGEATCEFTLPAGAAGLTVWFVALRIGEISNFIKTEIK